MFLKLSLNILTRLFVKIDAVTSLHFLAQSLLLCSLILLASSFDQAVCAQILDSSTNNDNLSKCLSGKVELKGENMLENNCRHKTSIKIVAANTSLDCKGSVIDGEGKYSLGIEIDSGGKPLRGIEIKNCTIINFKHKGILIGWSAPDSEKARKMNRGELYKASPTKVIIRNVKIQGAGTVGIYIDDYVTETLLDNVEISGTGGVGIYLEHSSKSTKIINSSIFNNGFTLKREGIAVDSSAENLITHSKIYGNYAGGIFLYRNCSEHLYQDPKQVKRWQSTDYNMIVDNEIYNEKVGIWVASRQSMNTSMMRCGNGYYAEGKFTMDSANYNTIFNNFIHDADYGVIVEDDNNTISGNSLLRIRKTGIKVGSIPRFKYLNLPVLGVRLFSNRFENVSENIIYIGESMPQKTKND